MRVPNPNQAHASISTTGTASTLDALGWSCHAQTATILVQAVGGEVRFTLNGTAPTAGSGLKLADGDMIELGLVEFGALKVITGSGSPKLEIAAYVLS